MDPIYYFSKNPDLAALHVAAFFFVLGLAVGWVLWSGNRRQVRNLDRENDAIAKQLETDCYQQTQLERESSLLS
ncbi:hypothetical protein EC9_45960 [Rosistilla ulvae]|uniref:Uncharacterized protein n=1 Tax=Rosistilla ulvae TaxID=1930277 RepID=A0A517M689_9BACT|nr:hypothetical protein [Rosistilla ulvae]QDS90388.1 hypothetical protein EC9_45960 [Rosistilla ulvae]